MEREIDQIVPQFQGESAQWELSIFPGFMHGFISFASTQLGDQFMNSLETVKYGCFVKVKEIGYKTDFSEQKLRFTFFFYCKTQISDFQGSKKNEIPEASLDINIPGLLVYHDFVSEEEERQLISAIDSKDWVRLKKRRVQHYGYEFVYGKNNVNSDNKLEELPTWLQPSLSRMDEIC